MSIGCGDFKWWRPAGAKLRVSDMKSTQPLLRWHALKHYVMTKSALLKLCECLLIRATEIYYGVNITCKNQKSPINSIHRFTTAAGRGLPDHVMHEGPQGGGEQYRNSCVVDSAWLSREKGMFRLSAERRPISSKLINGKFGKIDWLSLRDYSDPPH